ncbi:MAG: signal peptidase I [Planctomycetota bacterium]
MNLLERVRAQLQQGPASGGRLIEQLDVRRDAVLVYGALARLSKQGAAQSRGKGPGEQIWGPPGSGSRSPKPPGPPPSFQLDDEQLAHLEKEVWAITDGLPPHYFEELRRVVVARADKAVADGMKPDKAMRRALFTLGEPRPARRFLRLVDDGRVPALRLQSRRVRRLLLSLAAIFFLVGLIRVFVVGWYFLPEGQISMAPTLVPGVEGGDDIVIANLLAYRIDEPKRGEIAVFVTTGESVPYIKRIMGLPGERVALRDGDLFIDNERFVKDRALLDAVKVPLQTRADFEEIDGGIRQKAALSTGFPLPDGSIEPRRAACADFVLEAKVSIADARESITLLFEANGKPRHQVVLNGVGYEAGVFVGGQTVTRGTPCQLQPGRTYRLWITNADRKFRFDMDGARVGEATIEADPAAVRVSVLLGGEGARIEDLQLSRDLVYTSWPGAPDRWLLGDSAYFLLGDNSPVSRDSRSLGAISRENLQGRAWCVAWPLHRARALHR